MEQETTRAATGNVIPNAGGPPEETMNGHFYSHHIVAIKGEV